MWDPTEHPSSWRAVRAYSQRRAARDNRTLDAQENRARAVVAGEKQPRRTRFVTTRAGDAALAVAHHLQDTTGISIARIVRELRGLQNVTININGHRITAADPLTFEAEEILTSLSALPLAH